MKPLLIAASALGLAAIAAAVLTIGSPDRAGPPPRPGSVTAGGFTLVSTSVELPTDEAVFPAGPHADVVNASCTSCHSASMVLTQPPLSAEQWTAEVAKMRDVYRAPVAEADVPAIVAYLAGVSARQHRR